MRAGAVRRAIAIGQNTSTVATFNTVSSITSDDLSHSFNPSSSTPSETIRTVASASGYQLNDTVSPNSTDNNLSGSSDADLPTSLFNYDAPELQNLAKLNSQLVQDDLFSSPLY